MEEKTLTRLLIVVGAASLLLLFVLGQLSQKEFSGIMSKIVPMVVCEKDGNGEYIFAKPTSVGSCSEIRKAENLYEETVFCDGLSGEKKTACLGLIGIATKRYDDCISMIFGSDETSASSYDIEKYCGIMNNA